MQDYLNPRIGLIGKNAYAKKLGLKPSKVNLDGVEAYNLNKPVLQRYPTRSVIVHDIDDQWQADLMDNNYYLKYNDGYRYMLNVIDCFSKYAWSVPLKTKSGAEVARAFETIFSQSRSDVAMRQGRVPDKLQTDDGKEFFNPECRALFEKHQINHFSTKSQYKASMVESFNRTMRMRLGRLYTARNSFKWIDALDDLIYNYNNTEHSTIKMTPTEASMKKNTEEVHSNLVDIWTSGPSVAKPRFKVGDYVRISILPDPFAKSDKTPKWTVEVFQVSKIFPTVPITYKIKDMKGEELDSILYNQELNKTARPDPNAERRIEKVLDEKVVKEKQMIFVKYWGVNEKAWIPKDSTRVL